MATGQSLMRSRMNERIGYFAWLGLSGALACSSGAGGREARAVTAASVRSAEAPALATNDGARSPRVPLEYPVESDGDRVFIENAERAIAEYSQFIARAGESEEYAAAVKRSREQIEDLRAALVFVRAGAEQRGAH